MTHLFRAACFLLMFAAGSVAFGQDSAPAAPAAKASATPSPTPEPKPVAETVPPPSTPPVPLEPQVVVDSLSETDTKQALDLIRSNFVHSAALSEEGMNRALLQGLLERLGGGVSLQQATPDATSPSPFRAEILDDRIGYLRVGTLGKDRLAEFDTALGNFNAKKLKALILDLRATPPSSDFELAADYLKRFAPKGKMLFAVRRPAAKQERMLTSDKEPVFQGVIVTVVSRDSSGAAEVIAGSLRTLNNALVVGQKTSGHAAEYNELPLRGGKLLRVAVAEIKLPNDLPIFPEGLKPDLPVEIPAAEQAEALRIGLEKGVGGLVFETERPRLNEAALVAGVNPELDEEEADQRAGVLTDEKKSFYDPVLQRAVDLITTLQVFGVKPGK